MNEYEITDFLNPSSQSIPDRHCTVIPLSAKKIKALAISSALLERLCNPDNKSVSPNSNLAQISLLTPLWFNELLIRFVFS